MRVNTTARGGGGGGAGVIGEVQGDGGKQERGRESTRIWAEWWRCRSTTHLRVATNLIHWSNKILCIYYINIMYIRIRFAAHSEIHETRTQNNTIPPSESTPLRLPLSRFNRDSLSHNR